MESNLSNIVSQNKSLKSQLEDLDDAYDADLISKDEYNLKREKLLGLK